MLTVLLGGARSGKSTLAVELGCRHGGEVTFVATSPPALDDDLDGRIARHRAERPAWPTIEEPVDLAGALDRCGGSMAIVDCLTLWVGNLMARGDDDDGIARANADAVARATARTGDTVVVSNEVGSGVHPATELGMRYRDVLGRVNQRWAGAADRALLVVAGRALRLHDPFEALR